MSSSSNQAQNDAFQVALTARRSREHVNFTYSRHSVSSLVCKCFIVSLSLSSSSPVLVQSSLEVVGGGGGSGGGGGGGSGGGGGGGIGGGGGCSSC